MSRGTRQAAIRHLQSQTFALENVSPNQFQHGGVRLSHSSSVISSTNVFPDCVGFHPRASAVWIYPSTSPEQVRFRASPDFRDDTAAVPLQHGAFRIGMFHSSPIRGRNPPDFTGLRRIYQRSIPRSQQCFLNPASVSPYHTSLQSLSTSRWNPITEQDNTDLRYPIVHRA